jgi:ADP-ribosylation factor-like protein 2
VQVKAKEREIRVLMVGLDNAGKTTIVKRVNGESIDEISPTLGFNIKTMTHGAYALNIWDVGGQKTLRSYWKNYYEATDALIWVVDSADVRRMEDCKRELAAVLGEEKLAGASALIFANKRDIQGAMDVESMVDALGLRQLENRHWKIVGCSAVNGEGLLDGFDWLVDDVASRIYLYD